jgi:pectate lyase
MRLMMQAYAVESMGAFPRDPMDRRIMGEIAAGTFTDVPRDQPVTEDAFALDFDPADPPAPPLDTDQDGMPDAWEIAHGLDPAVQDHNGTALSASGYTNLELYLNELALSIMPFSAAWNNRRG